MDELYFPFLVAAFVLTVAMWMLYFFAGPGGADETGPNRVIGIKTKQTLRSDAAWVAGHAAARPTLLNSARLGTVVVAALGTWAVVADAGQHTALAVACGTAAGLMAGSLIAVVRVANKAAAAA